MPYVPSFLMADKCG